MDDPSEEPQTALPTAPTPSAHSTASPVPPTDDVLAKLRAKVAERRANSEYPADLPERLLAHFEATRHRTQPVGIDIDELGRLVGEAREAGRFALEKIPTDSDLPGGQLVHRALQKAMARQARGVLEQVKNSTQATQRVVERLAHGQNLLQRQLQLDVDGLEQRGADLQVEHRKLALGLEKLRSETGGLEKSLDEIEQRLAALAALATQINNDAAHNIEAIDTRLAALDRSVADIERRLDSRLIRLERIEQSREFRPWYDHDAFEARFRGSRVEISARYGDLAKLLVGQAPVLDIGCGRGELLDQLRHHGVDAYGVEMNPSLVEEVQRHGHRATLADGLLHLSELDDEQLGGIALIQVIEHLTPQHQLDLVALAYRKLRAGGRLVIETVNPTSLYVFGWAMYLDPTHTQPVHPKYLNFVLEQAGFAKIELAYRSPVPEESRPTAGLRGGAALTAEAGTARHDAPADAPADAPLARVEDAIRRIDDLLFAKGQDYLLVATK